MIHSESVSTDCPVLQQVTVLNHVSSNHYGSRQYMVFCMIWIPFVTCILLLQAEKQENMVKSLKHSRRLLDQQNALYNTST